MVSLRYDKLGAGLTGLGSFAVHPQNIAFDVYVQEALDGLTTLALRPEVDFDRLAIVGHSEGGLIAVVAARQPSGGGQPAALALVEPLAVRYFDLLGRQITDQYSAAVQAGQLTQDQANALIADLARVIAATRQTGQLPAQSLDPSVRRLFASSLQFLYTADQYDPLAIAPARVSLPVLLSHGSKDSQVSADDVANLANAFTRGGDTMVDFEENMNMDHVLSDVESTPDPASDCTNPDLPYSAAFAQRLQNFADEYLGAS